MITEMVVLNVKAGFENEFERSFDIAKQYIKQAKGYITHSLKKCIETKNRYLLIIEWDNLDDHMVGFRESDNFIKWKELLHHFYEPTPVVEHYSSL